MPQDAIDLCYFLVGDTGLWKKNVLLIILWVWSGHAWDACRASQTTLFMNSYSIHEWEREGFVCSYVSVVLGMRDHPYCIIAFLFSASFDYYRYHVFRFTWYRILHATSLIDLFLLCAVAMSNMFKELLSWELDDWSLFQSDYLFGRSSPHISLYLFLDFFMFVDSFFF